MLQGRMRFKWFNGLFYSSTYNNIVGLGAVKTKPKHCNVLLHAIKTCQRIQTSTSTNIIINMYKAYVYALDNKQLLLDIGYPV